MKMSRDELEYAISQYLDGALPPLERATLDERLATDAEARAVLEEYRALNGLLKACGNDLPNIKWDRLGARIQQSLEDVETPVRHFRIGSIGWTGRLAIAAALLFAASLAFHFVLQGGSPTGVKPSAPAVAIVSGPAPQREASPAVAEISIGPSPTLAHDWRAAEEVITRPAVVLIDQVHSSGQDGDGMY